MTRVLSYALLLALSIDVISSQTQNSTPAPVVKPNRPSLTERLLKFLGISANPSTFKGPGDEVVTGDVWLVDVTSQRARPLTSFGGYRSPVFVDDSSHILALRGTDVIQLSISVTEEKKLFSVFGITKLVGCSAEDANKVVVLMRGDGGGRPQVHLLTISTGKTEPIQYDSSSSQDLQMVESLEGWTRTYGSWELYVESQTKQALSGTIEWTDIFLKVGNDKPVDLSRCDGFNCGQPSLSKDKRLAVFVKSLAD